QQEHHIVNKLLNRFGNRVNISALLSEDYEKWIDKTINICGWVKNLRIQGSSSFIFVELNDGSSVKNIQVIIDKTIEGFDKLKDQGIGASLAIRGKIVKSPGKNQSIELQVSKNDEHYTEILGECSPSEYKLFKSKLKLEYLRE